MKTLTLIATMFILASCTKEETIEPQPLSKWELTDSTAIRVNCQLIIYRAYTTYHKGQPAQIAHTKEVIGEPCNQIDYDTRAN